jgi:hypothetical protein
VGPVGTPCTLRSTSWDGPPPAPGDLVCTTAGSWYLVTTVAAGAGVGHYRLGVVRRGRQRPPEADEADATVWLWTWLPRGRR